jgi:hypothetical protein
MACRPSQNRKRPEEESKRGAASQPNPIEERRGMTRDPKRKPRRPQRSRLLPPSAAKLKAAPKAAFKETSTKPKASDATKRTTKQAKEQESKASASKWAAIAGNLKNE